MGGRHALRGLPRPRGSATIVSDADVWGCGATAGGWCQARNAQRVWMSWPTSGDPHGADSDLISTECSEAKYDGTYIQPVKNCRVGGWLYGTAPDWIQRQPVRQGTTRQVYTPVARGMRARTAPSQSLRRLFFFSAFPRGTGTTTAEGLGHLRLNEMSVIRSAYSPGWRKVLVACRLLTSCT